MDQERKDFLFKELESRPLLVLFGDNWFVQPETLVAAGELLAGAMESKVSIAEPFVPQSVRNRERRTSVAAAQIRQTFNELMEARGKIAGLEAQLEERGS